MVIGTNEATTRKPADAKVEELPITAYADRVENYTPERLAEFLLNNAVGPEDHAAALEEVRKLGIDPATIPHVPPKA